MAFIDPFEKIDAVDASNVLSINVSFLNDPARDGSRKLDGAIEILDQIRNTLLALQAGGTDIGGVPNSPYYVDAVRWLNFEVGLTNFVTVPAIANYADITDEIADQFLNHVNEVRRQLVSQEPYASTDRIISVLGASFTTVTESAKTHLSNHLGALTELKKEEINDTSNEAIRNYQQAQALTEWAGHYRQLVEEYRNKVYGKEVIRETKNRETAKKRMKSRIKQSKSTISKWIGSGLFSLRNGIYIFIDSSFINFIGYRLSTWKNKFFSYQGRRTTWFVILSAVLLAQAFVFIVATAGLHPFGWDFSSFVPQHNDSQLFIKIGIVTSILLPVTLGYAFSSKNYRIYANLYEQYRHREIVASTLQGIITGIQENDGNSDVRTKLTEIGGKAMFEHKAIGHLSKKDSEHSPFAEVVQTVVPRST